MEVCVDHIIKRTEQMEAKLAGYKYRLLLIHLNSTRQLHKTVHIISINNRKTPLIFHFH
jgi:hypothetical protein